MPELPEVETIRRDLERGLLRKTLERVEIIDSTVIRQPIPSFTRALRGQTITAVDRRGKALTLQLGSGAYLVVQVMMTGQMVLNGAPDASTRGIFHFKEGGHVLYNDQRKFGQLRVVKDPSEIKYFRILGPEPFAEAFSPAYIAASLKKTTRPIKNVLMDHTFVAGIGNIYASEILFHSRINPERPAHRIKQVEIPALLAHTHTILQEAIEYRGSSMRNYRDGAGVKGTFNTRIKVYAREGEACAVCQTPIRRIVQAGRSTFYCRRCQR